LLLSFNVNVDAFTVPPFKALLKTALTVVVELTPVAPLAGVVPVTLSGGGVAAIVMLKLLLAAPAAESVACTVKLNAPLALGVPVMLPFVFRLRPPGSAPAAMDHVYGGVPPLAVSVAE
jgi:hypothetical protein